MADVDHMQSAFTGGELSHRLHGRFMEPIYARALARCADWEVLPQGSIMRRPGTLSVAALPNDPNVRFIPMRMKDEQDFVLVLTDRELRIFAVQGGVLLELSGTPGATQQLVVNGDFGDGTNHWTVWDTPTAVQVVGGKAVYSDGVPAPGLKVARLGQNFTLASAQDVVLSLDVSVLAGGIVTVIGGALEANAWPSGTEVLHTTITATGTFHQSLRLPAGTYGLMLQGALLSDGSVKTAIDNVSIAYATPGSGSGSTYALTAPWLSRQLSDVKWVAESAGDRMYLVHPDVPPYYIQRGSNGQWSLQVMTFTSPPAEWGAGNWPSVAEFYQSRLWLANTRQHPNTIWASETGNAFNFTTHEVIGGTDQTLAYHAIAAPLASKGAVHWMMGRQMLVFGTDLAEHAIQASGTITSSNIQIRVESGFGSSSMQAIDLGSQVLYVSRDRRKARLLDFSLETQAWMSRDLTFVAEHLTGAFIHEAHHAKDPNGTVALLLDDGTLACCTYDRGEQIAGWWTASLTGGTALTAAVSNGPQGSVLHMAVQRDSGIWLEAMAFSEFHPSRVYLDAAKVVDVSGVSFTDGVATIPGFAHLAGHDVDVTLDGAYLGRQVVSGGGTIAIESGGSRLVAGVPYTSVAETLPPAGAKQRARRRWVKLYLRLHGSALPLVSGTTDGAAQRVAPDRSDSTPLDSPEPLFTGDVGDQGLSGDWESRGQVYISADLPLRTEVLAIYGTLAVQEV